MFSEDWFNQDVCVHNVKCLEIQKGDRQAARSVGSYQLGPIIKKSLGKISVAPFV